MAQFALRDNRVAFKLFKEPEFSDSIRGSEDILTLVSHHMLSVTVQKPKDIFVDRSNFEH
jgi:hypothetical protein